MLDVARHIADAVLSPLAEQVDQTTIPASHFTALADAGLFSLEGLSPTEARRVMAAVAGGCGATFFVWVQHHGVRRTLQQSINTALQTALANSLRSGRMLAGTAFAHVRRAGRPAVSATRVEGGWRFDGVAPWATSWGYADRFCVAAESPDGEIVWAMLPGDGGTGVMAVPLHLPVFAATGTVALRFESCVVANADVVLVADADAWRGSDRIRASLGQPAVLGVAERAVLLLRGAARSADDPATAAAERLDDAIAHAWQRDSDMMDLLAQPDSDDQAIVVASDHRAACLDIGQRATRALLAAVGGAGMGMAHPAQRLAREANFYVIQAQTTDGRAATLRAT